MSKPIEDSVPPRIKCWERGSEIKYHPNVALSLLSFAWESAKEAGRWLRCLLTHRPDRHLEEQNAAAKRFKTNPYPPAA